MRWWQRSNGGGRAIAVAADVSQGAAVTAMVERVASEFGPIDILVNNAGVAIVRRIDELTEAISIRPSRST